MSMKLSEIFEQLTQGELSQVALGGGELGTIHFDNYRAAGNHVKLGLTALYKRFDLKRGSLIVELKGAVFTYILQSKYAIHGRSSKEPIRWINDTADSPFRNDIVKILAITGDTGTEFPLNDYADCYSIVTPTMDSIRVPIDVVHPTMDLPDCYKTTKLKIDYMADHPNFMPRAGFGILEPDKCTIELPSTHLQALLYFVASRVHNPIGMGQEFNAGNNWALRYESECRRLEDDGMEINQGSQVNRARRNGWV